MGPDDRSARVLAEHAGFEIVEAGDRVWFFDRGTRAPTIAAAVSGGVAALALLNALLLGLSLLAGGGFTSSWPAVGIVAALALLAGLVCRVSLQLRSRRLARPRVELPALALLDRATGMLLDANGRSIAPVTQVRVGRGMLIGSSAPAVFLRPPAFPRIEVYRSSLVGGGDIDRTIDALVKLGFARS